MIVLKFGGSSLADSSRIRQVMRIIEHQIPEYKSGAIVLSAYQGVTNDLITFARQAAAADKKYEKVLAALQDRHLLIERSFGHFLIQIELF